jgi:hypothetical protein
MSVMEKSMNDVSVPEQELLEALFAAVSQKSLKGFDPRPSSAWFGTRTTSTWVRHSTRCFLMDVIELATSAAPFATGRYVSCCRD